MSDYAQVIDTHNALRDKCCKLAKADPSLMGQYAWLVHAMIEADISLEPGRDWITCYGNTFTTQTLDHEWFEFRIPLELLD